MSYCKQATWEHFATANADTWATELGILSTTEPRLITTKQRVSPGTSGGITGLGTTAAAGGALSLGLVFQLLQRHVSPVATFTALVSGLVGSLYDSLLGATIQATYYCSTCDKETEQHVHSCGTRTRLLRGLSWMNNDVVNFLATLVGGLVAMTLHALFSYLLWKTTSAFLTCGDLDAARSALQQFEHIGTSKQMSQPFYFHMRSLFTTIDQVRLWLACGELGRATRWAEELDS